MATKIVSHESNYKYLYVCFTYALRIRKLHGHSIGTPHKQLHTYSLYKGRKSTLYKLQPIPVLTENALHT